MNSAVTIRLASSLAVPTRPLRRSGSSGLRTAIAYSAQNTAPAT